MQLATVQDVAGGFVFAHMGDWGNMGGWGWGMAIFGWLFMIAIVGLVVWLVATVVRRPERPGGDRTGPMNTLDERYARGEIDREEYLQRRADLER